MSTTYPSKKNKNINTWIFDLDNTLYKSNTNLFSQIEKKIGTYVAQTLCINESDAKFEQKRLFHKYGSTLRGLMTEHRIEPEMFLEYVHDIDYSILDYDEELNSALKELPGKKLIYTNGSNKHAVNVVERLGIMNHVDGFFDIVNADFKPKPDPKPLDKFIDKFGINPTYSLMIEDMLQNLEPAAALGMTTLWIKTENLWAGKGNLNCADYQTDSLTDWLCSFSKNSL